ncbi:MAG TPA: TIGR03086 family metal-binding protein [Streptosporangiaceae bacterium]|nr:TIGR03086 family metal-binding protein [Streptosporangiaceae bacterium]
MTEPTLVGHDLVELHGRCGQRFAEIVDGVGSQQWHDDTPCSAWDVRTLTHHMLYEQRWVPPLCDGLTIAEIGDGFEGDLLGDDVSAWPGLVGFSIDEAHAAVARPGVLDRIVHLSFGDFPGQEYVIQLTADLAIHGWDLARATGQDAAIDPGAVAPLLRWAQARADFLAASGMFGSRINVSPDDPDDVRLLALLGRQA